MISYIRKLMAQKRLQRLVEANRNSLSHQQFLKRSAAGKLGHQRRSARA